jgi:DNA-binding NarL/FixJ family response regulator
VHEFFVRDAQAAAHFGRLLDMTVEAKAPSLRAVRVARRTSLLTVASTVEVRRRIADALLGENLEVAAEISDPGRATDLDLDSISVIVIACDIDAARELAALRRLCKEVRGPSVVVISPPSSGMGVRRALDAGADGVVFAPELELTLASAILAVAIGQAVVPRKLRASFERPSLSHRENQVLTLVCSGLTNAEIAERLFLAESTIKSHLSSIFTKFGVRSRREAAAAFADVELAPVPGAVRDVTD